ncbi:hypothetical protein FO519_009424 [Halicephalobus sp. NKZ332]|nr:hypothetical protein FO519_009424 [Halicephalobus sp. NKZ332]
MRRGFRLVLVLSCILVITFLYQQLDFSSSPKNSRTYLDSRVINDLRGCLGRLNPEERLDFFVTSLVTCLQMLPKLRFFKSQKNRFNEAKVFFPLNRYFNQSSCTWLTIGIGGSTSIEKEFKKKYPKCKIYGIEASEDQFADFDKIGKVIPYGVGVEAGNFVVTLRDHELTGQDPSYEKNITLHPFSEILDEYVGQRLVHFVTIDLEGFEYSILEELMTNGGKLSRQGIVFCQIDAELHYFNEEHAAALRRLMKTVSKYDSDYIPVDHSWYMGIHHKITFVNFGNRECRRAFDIRKLFD